MKGRLSMGMGEARRESGQRASAGGPRGAVPPCGGLGAEPPWLLLLLAFSIYLIMGQYFVSHGG